MEYYGPKPEKFTKKWWEYFWDYYKWHTIVVVFVIVAIIATVIQVSNQTKYDGNLILAGNIAFPQEYSDKLQAHVEAVADDLDGDGQKAVFIEQLPFSENDTDAQYSAAMRTKFNIKLQTNEGFAFIMDEELTKQTLSSSELEGCFVPLDEWLREDVKEEDIYYFNDKPYAVKLTNSKILKDMGFSGDYFYAALRYNYDSEDEELEKQFENAAKILNAVVKAQ